MALTDAAAGRRQILIVDDEEGLRHMLVVLLSREGYAAVAASSAEQALAELERRSFDVVLSDVRMPKLSGLELLDRIREREIAATVILMSAFGTVDLALEAMKRGAYDYIGKPFKPEELVLVLRKAEERERLLGENRRLARALAEREGDPRALLFPSMIAESVRMREVLKTVRKVAEYKSTVLITGESGTGKELIARALHAASPRRDEAFVAVNCGAIPEALLESELFGHRKGAFTDAHRDKIGLFEEASGGTLFLDEIGDLPLALQVKLLRVLQEQEIRPLGATSDVKVDVRVVAATMRDLPEEVKEGRFREDLFYRLNVLPIHLPPLRERREEIPPLALHFVEKTNKKLGTRIQGVQPEAMKLLLDHGWPGNVRELENTIERAMVLAEGSTIEPSGLPDKLREPGEPLKMSLLGGELSIKKVTRLIEEELIRRALKETRGNRTNAAKILEISHRALLYKIKEYGIRD